MRLFIIDTETTGTSATAQICEIAGTQYEIAVDGSYKGAIASISTLMPVFGNDAEFINGIVPKLTRVHEGFSAEYGTHKLSVSLFKEMAIASDYCVAFNAEFDAPLIDALIGAQRWLCAMQDFDWGYTRVNPYGGYKLIDLALWMGIGISTAHRAGDDVRLLVECMNRSPNLQEMIERGIVRSNSPTIEFQACVSYDNRELAKAAGFGWDGTRKIWIKKLKECDSAVFLESLNFETTIVSINGKTDRVVCEF